MKIFSPSESSSVPVKTNSKAKAIANAKAKKAPALPVKQDISANEIREKLASHSELSNSAKSQMIQKNSQALGAGFMNQDAKPLVVATDPDDIAEQVESKSSLKDSHLLLTDVKLNDPNDSNTQEKLKTVLKMGAFNFNPKEKEALEKILGGS